jgi:hypothetical protein
MDCPAEPYTPLPRPYAGLPEIDYPFGDQHLSQHSAGAFSCKLRALGSRMHVYGHSHFNRRTMIDGGPSTAVADCIA